MTRFCAPVRRLAHPGHGQAHGVPAADVFLLQQRELQVEEFLELEAVGGLRQGVLVYGEVDLPEGVAQRDQPFLPDDVVRQRLLEGGEDEVQGRSDELAHEFAGDSARLELLRRRVHARQDAGLRVFGGVELGMDHVDAAVEGLRLAEEEERVPRDEPPVHVLDALEEHDLHLAAVVADEGGQAAHRIVLELVRGQFGAVLGEQANLQDGAHDLHVGLVRADVGDFLDGTAVDVTERIQVHEVSHRRHLQLAPQERRPPRTYARKVLDVRFHRLAHNAKIINLS